MKLKEIFYNILPRGLRNSVTKRQLLRQNYPYSSFSQAGEDKVLDVYFAGKTSGFYVDIGAYHPYIYSNTFKFYLKGWRGINVDACPGTKKLFDALRPGDINVQSGVSLTPGELDYYMFDNGVFNTFNKDTAAAHCREFSISVKQVMQVQTNTLAEILNASLPALQKIDFMSIDVEGLDLDVLRSNDWEKYKPEVLVVECVYADYDDIQHMEVVIYLRQLGYSFFAKIFSSFFFSLTKSR